MRMVKIRNERIAIGITTTIVVIILAVAGVFVGMFIAYEAEHPYMDDNEFVGEYFCNSPGGRDTSCTLIINSDYTFTVPPYTLSGDWHKVKDSRCSFAGSTEKGTYIYFNVDSTNHNKLTMSFTSTDGNEKWTFYKVNN